MVYAAESDPLCYPGTTVLRNLLDIRDAELLEEAELALFLTRSEEPFPNGDFDVEHYLSLHRHLFQDVYAWAGEIRNVRIGKDGIWFCYPEYIGAELDRTFVELGTITGLRKMAPANFARHVGHFLAELNAIHPFREGNGRTQLALLAILSEGAGFGYDRRRLDRSRVMRAMIDSFSGDPQALVSLIREVIA